MSQDNQETLMNRREFITSEMAVDFNPYKALKRPYDPLQPCGFRLNSKNCQTASEE